MAGHFVKLGEEHRLDRDLEAPNGLLSRGVMPCVGCYTVVLYQVAIVVADLIVELLEQPLVDLRI